MKTIIDTTRMRLSMLMLALVTGSVAFAQDASTTTESHTTVTHSDAAATPDPNAWYMSPVVWVIGAVLLIIVIYLIFRGGSKSNAATTQVTRTTTTTTEIKNV